jgi:4-hydroxybenzoate polyprenyltransferase
MIAFLFSPLGRRVVAVVAVGVALVAVAVWLMDKGADRAVDKINRQNERAVDAATKARNACAADPSNCVRDEWTRDREK